MLLVQAGSGVATLGLPDSPGVPPGATADALVADYNDLGSVADLFESFRDEIAAVIVEPVAGNMGLGLPEPGFLEGLRDLTSCHGALLIFDEVLSGFRGPPIRRSGEVRDHAGPRDTREGRRWRVAIGCLRWPPRRHVGRRTGGSDVLGGASGNPLAVAAGLTTLRKLREPGVFKGIEAKAARLIAGIADAAQSAGVSVQTTLIGTLACVFFNGMTRSLDSARRRSLPTRGFPRTSRACPVSPVRQHIQ